MGKTTRKRKTELVEVQRRGFEAGRPFHYGEFWQACGKAGPENQYTGVYARRQKGKRWGEIVVQWDGQETRIGTFERVKGKDGEPVWMGRLELTGEWSRLPGSVRIDEAHIHGDHEDRVRDYLVNRAVEYFVSYGRPETKYTTNGRVHSDGTLEVVPLVPDTSGTYYTRFVSGLDVIDAFNPYIEKKPILEAGAEVHRSAVRSHAVIGEMATVSKSTINKGCVVNGNVRNSYLGSRVWVGENANLSHAFIGGEVHIGPGAFIKGTKTEKAEIYPPEVHIPAGVVLAEDGYESTLRYLVLGPIGDCSLTAVGDVHGNCIIQFSGKKFTLAELKKALKDPESMYGHPLSKTLRSYDQYTVGQLEALLPLLTVTFPNGD